VSLVEHHQFIGFNFLFSKSCKDPFACQSINTDNDPITLRTDEGVVVFCIAPADNVKWQAEQQLQFVLPIADKTCRRDDQNAFQQAARQHLTDVEARHNGFAGTGVIGQQKTQPRLLQHVIIDRNPLMGQRIDTCYFSGKRGVCQVSERESFSLNQRPDNIRVGREVECGWCAAIRRRFRFGNLRIRNSFTRKFQQAGP
jgi:hypothetical protein